jgi:hypothetical protein
MIDLTNVAYSDEYIKYKEKAINLAYSPNNKIDETEIAQDDLRRVKIEYVTKRDEITYYCGNDKVYINNELVFEYFSLYSHPFFCKKITYANGKEYLFYKTDLYGYSAAEISTGRTFDYYPKHSFGKESGETFIATDIHFNPTNNFFAVDGCYWACPLDTFLIHIDDPLKQFDKYANTHLIFDEDYNKYDDIEFLEWEKNAVKLKCYNVQTEPYKHETIAISEKRYMEKMINL